MSDIDPVTGVTEVRTTYDPVTETTTQVRREIRSGGGSTPWLLAGLVALVAIVAAVFLMSRRDEAPASDQAIAAATAQGAAQNAAQTAQDAAATAQANAQASLQATQASAQQSTQAAISTDAASASADRMAAESAARSAAASANQSRRAATIVPSPDVNAPPSGDPNQQ
ncbi:MAG: hypothetical protein ABI306_03330 [Caulobacteraceae bacterium]